MDSESKTHAGTKAAEEIRQVAGRVSGFRSSVADGLYATADVAVGTGLVLAVPYAGVPVSIVYSAHGGSKALVNDVGYMTGKCRAQ
jgi:hypothetical protein